MSEQDSHATLGKTVVRLFRQPSFLVAFAVLLLAAVGLNAATQFMQLHFKKLPVPIARSLELVPMRIGSWQCISKDQLADDVQQELDTDQYIMRFYVDTSVIQREDMAAFEGKDNKAVAALLSKLREKYRGRLDRAIISMAVTYYTGKADTVAHIPERCYTADGYEPQRIQNERWDLKTPQSPDGKLDVRYISFEDQANTARVIRNVAYFFHVNGKYTNDSTVVRLALQNLMAKYGYYAKIELMIQDKDREASGQAMQDFLISALPEIESCLPDWSKVNQK